jgi:hypothetical protein
MAATACTQSSSALAPDPEPAPEEAPSVVEMAAVSVPAFDGDVYKVTCQTSTGLCPIVRWEGVDYVALSYRDNRFSLALHAFGSTGAVLGVREMVGARYLAAAQVDAATRAVTFVGQADHAVSLSWDDLRALR